MASSGVRPRYLGSLDVVEPGHLRAQHLTLRHPAVEFRRAELLFLSYAQR